MKILKLKRNLKGKCYRHTTGGDVSLKEGVFNYCLPVLLIRIRSDQYHFPGSGSIPKWFRSGSYNIEHNKINWKGKFNKVCLLFGSWHLLTRKNQVRGIKSTIILGTVGTLFEKVRIRILIKKSDPDPHRMKGSDPDPYHIENRIQIKMEWISNTAAYLWRWKILVMMLAPSCLGDSRFLMAPKRAKTDILLLSETLQLRKYGRRHNPLLLCFGLFWAVEMARH